MDQKPQNNQNAGFFKPYYLTKNLRYEVEFLDMIKSPRSTKYQLAASSGCAQVSMNISKKTNSESALSQE